MAPSISTGALEPNFDGYWGKPTATIDWCEANYEVTYYIAEFWNTVSNLIMIIPPLIGAILSHKDRLERHFVWGHLGVALVGIGSWCFHGTLLYEMQLLDELPMIWSSSILIYMLVQVDCKPKSSSIRLQCLLFSYCLLVTVVYLAINEPVFHEAAYGLMVLALVIFSVRIARKYECSWPLMVSSISFFCTGFLLWNIDNLLCVKVREMRQSVGYPIKPFLQGHAWWHLLAGMGTYLFLLFATHARACFLARPVQMKSVLAGCCPYIRAPLKGPA